MLHRRTNRVLSLTTLISVFLLLVACAPMIKPVDLNGHTDLVWPGQPEIPRIEYVTSFNHPDHFAMNQGFFNWLGEIFTGEQNRKMVRPMAITQISDQTLFVSDPGVKGIHRYNLRQKRYTLIRLNEDALLPSPVGMAADKNDNVYVVDSELAQLFKIEKNKKSAAIVTLEEKLIQPTAVAIDNISHTIYITDTGTHQVKRFSFDGKLISVIGKRGTGNSEFNFPTMIWLDKTGQLYVTDSLNFRIQIFNHADQFVRSIGQQGDSTGNQSRSKGVATDSQGHIYVVDALFNVFQLFDKNGRFLLHVGGQGQGKGEFWLPSGIFITDNDIIYIADSHNQRVQVFRYIGGQL